jgi:hypothetical protein
MTACNLAAEGGLTISLPPPRHSPNRAARQRARYFRGPTWSCAEWAMALVGRAVALTPDDQHRPDALREGARVLAALVRDHEIHKPDAVDRILNAGVAFGIDESTIYEILRSEFAS